MASNPNPFASDSSGLARMLQAAFSAMPQGGGQLEQMPIPNMRRAPTETIDLGAGGAAPGSQRGNFLSSLGSLAQNVAPMIGGALASRAAATPAPQAGAWKSTALPGSNITAPQLGPATNFSNPSLNLSLNPATPRPLFSFKG